MQRRLALFLYQRSDSPTECRPTVCRTLCASVWILVQQKACVIEPAEVRGSPGHHRTFNFLQRRWQRQVFLKAYARGPLSGKAYRTDVRTAAEQNAWTRHSLQQRLLTGCRGTWVRRKLALSCRPSVLGNGYDPGVIRLN
jgi:hypothetical protein